MSKADEREQAVRDSCRILRAMLDEFGEASLGECAGESEDHVGESWVNARARLTEFEMWACRMIALPD